MFIIQMPTQLAQMICIKHQPSRLKAILKMGMMEDIYKEVLKALITRLSHNSILLELCLAGEMRALQRSHG